jgi:hypothetical protein
MIDKNCYTYQVLYNNKNTEYRAKIESDSFAEKLLKEYDSKTACKQVWKVQIIAITQVKWYKQHEKDLLIRHLITRIN